MIKRPELFKMGFHLSSFALPSEINNHVRHENWTELDQEFKRLTAKNGELFSYLKEFHDFESIEFIISIRDAQNEWEEDGIWHDDGTRVFAFSLSLTENAIEGGLLGIRRIGEEETQFIPTPDYGGIITFLTGVYGYEHKIHQVKKGRRVIIAGWCS